jgi:hypothetical protein
MTDEKDLASLCPRDGEASLGAYREDLPMRISRVSIAKLQATLMLVAGMAFTSSSISTADVPSTTTGASIVTSQNACVWWYEDFPTNLLLSAGAGERYEGLDLELTDTDEPSIKLYISGNSVEGEPPAGDYDSNTECTWYRTVLIEGIEVLVDVDSTSVDSSDSGLAFDYTDPLNGDLEGALEGLNITNTPDVTCDAYWSSQSAIQLNLTSIGANVATAYASNPPKTKLNDSDSDRCAVELDYSVVVPGDLLPAAPGTATTFTLPSIVWTVTAAPTVLP